MNAVYYKKVLNYFLGELERRRLEDNQKLINHYLDEINELEKRYQYKNA